MPHQRARLFGRRNVRPQRENSGHVVVSRTRLLLEIIIEIETTFAVPKIFLNSRLAILRAFAPLLSFLLASERLGDVLQILFRLVQKAVQTDGSIVVRRSAVGSKAKRDVISRFSHRAVTLVLIPPDRHASTRITFHLGHGGM